MTSLEDEILAGLARDDMTVPVSARPVLEAYVGQLARLRDARERVDAEGEIIAGPRDQPVVHPALVVERQAAAELLKLHRQLVAECQRDRTRQPTTGGLDDLSARRAKRRATAG